MEAFLIRALQLILCFSILIFLHEGGHFLAARLFKIRVEKFALFFDPWFSLFKFKPKKSDTTYVLGWLPLGGYVKIAGMIDESMDKEQMQQPVQPWEFRAKPAWQRLIVMLAGVFVNFILALFIYAMILFTWGDTYVPMRNIDQGFAFNERARQFGFQNGDIPLHTDKVTFDRFDSNESMGDVYRGISEARSVTVLRQGKEVTLSLPGEINMIQMMKEEPPFLLPLSTAVVDSLPAGSPAAQAGVHVGDSLVSYNGSPCTTWNEYTDIRARMEDVLAAQKPADSLRLRQVTLVVARAATGVRDTLRFQLTPEYALGISHYSPFKNYKTVTKNYTFLSSFPAGFSHGWHVLKGYVTDLKYIFTKDGAKSIGSFGTIGSLFPTTWVWERFWELTAFISLMLAFMNILPIPALDGGHAFFLFYEVITRRKPSDKFMENAEKIGIFLLLGLMAYALFNDVLKFIF